MADGPDRAAARPIIRVTFRPEPGIDAVRALRRALKFALRACGLRCLSITEERADGAGR